MIKQRLIGLALVATAVPCLYFHVQYAGWILACGLWLVLDP
jgi:hypothetical protein